jgi:hypothetical protein
VGQTGSQSRQVEHEIERQRQELADNLVLLETKVQRTVDWRLQYQKRPFVALAIVFVAGIILSMLIPDRHRHD